MQNSLKPVFGQLTANKTIEKRISEVFVSEEEIAPILEKTMIWFKLNANQKERLGVAIDRLGVEKFEKDVLENDELLEKKDILFE